jgi:hypothetical protein
MRESEVAGGSPDMSGRPRSFMPRCTRTWVRPGIEKDVAVEVDLVSQ